MIMGICGIRCPGFRGTGRGSVSRMLRLLFVVDAALTEHDVARAVPRTLRDLGHEVVYAAGLVDPDQVVATAVQEDVDAVLLLDAVSGGQMATQVANLLQDGGAGDITVLPVGPEVTAAEVEESVRRVAGEA